MKRDQALEHGNRNQASTEWLSSFSCRICGSSRRARLVLAPEVMHQLDEAFEYAECGSCGCFQISKAPADIERYYGGAYYSFDSNSPSLKQRILDALRLRGSSRMFGGLAWFDVGAYRAVADLPRQARILDVGCGVGHLARAMRENGFTSVLGIDPFIQADVLHRGKVLVRKASIEDIDDRFDVIALHHSFEHIWDQRGALEGLRRVLAPGGKLIIRIPTVDSWAFSKYALSWANFDAPRHFYLHSRKSICGLLFDSGFSVTQVKDEFSPFGVAASLRVRQGLSSIASDVPSRRELASDLAQARRAAALGWSDHIAVHAIARP